MRRVPVVDLQSLLQAWQESCYEGLKARQQSPLQWEIVTLIQCQQHRLHCHGRMAQEWEQSRAKNQIDTQTQDSLKKTKKQTCSHNHASTLLEALKDCV